MGERLDPLLEVIHWLDGDTAGFVTRTEVLPGQSHAWRIRTPNAITGHELVLSLNPQFPGELPRIFLAKENFLRFPHVERDGALCLRMDQFTAEGGADLVGLVLREYEDFEKKCRDPEWVAAEFEREKALYWYHNCLQAKDRSSLPPVRRLYMDPTGLARPIETGVSQYGYNAFIGASIEPSQIAKRHGFNTGQVRSGAAHLVPVPDGEAWGPSHWPRTFAHLQAAVARFAGGEFASRFVLNRKQAKPLFVVFFQRGIGFAYQVLPPPVPQVTQARVIPMQCNRLDPSWVLFRDHDQARFDSRAAKRVLVLGCGSLGSVVIELLARAGVGQLDIVDFDTMETENGARHVLGLGSVSRFKVKELSSKLERDIPGLSIRSYQADARSHIDKLSALNYDLVVDCTGDSAVRTYLAMIPSEKLNSCPVAHIWMEPYAAAGHVVLVTSPDRWPANDPAGTAVNMARWPDNGTITPPACSSSFAPYASSDCYQIGGFAAERLLEQLTTPTTTSEIWTWHRTRAYFERFGCKELNAAVKEGGPFAPTVIRRNLCDVLK